MMLMKRRSEQNKSFESEDIVDEQKNEEVKSFDRRCKDEIDIGRLQIFMSFTFVSLIFYVVDIVSDIIWLKTFYVQEEYWYFCCTLAFLVIPAVTTSLLFYNFERMKQNENTSDPRDFLPKEISSADVKWNIGSISPIPRYWNIIKYDWKAKQTKAKTDNDLKKMYFLAMIWEDAELNQSRQFDSFMESVPQLLLNLYIMSQRGYHFQISSLIFLVFSVVSLSWTLVSYDQKIDLLKAIKRDNEKRQNKSSDIRMSDMTKTVVNYIGNFNLTKITLLFFANIFFMASRLMAFSWLASSFGINWYVWPIYLNHLLAIFIWQLIDHNFMDSLRIAFMNILAYLFPLEKEPKAQYPRFTPLFYLLTCFNINAFMMMYWSQSLIEGDDRLSFIKSCALPPWHEWSFFIPWILQLSTIFASSLLFWLFYKKRQSEEE